MSDDTILLKSDRILGYYGIQPDELKELLEGQYQGHNTLQDVSDKEMEIILHLEVNKKIFINICQNKDTRELFGSIPNIVNKFF